MQRKKKKRREHKHGVPKTKPTPMEPQGPTQQALTVIPFSVVRDAHQMPFKQGQGITLLDWQFVIIMASNDGTLGLKPIGRIVPIEKSPVEL